MYRYLCGNNKRINAESIDVDQARLKHVACRVCRKTIRQASCYAAVYKSVF